MAPDCILSKNRGQESIGMVESSIAPKWVLGIYWVNDKSMLE